MLNLTSKQRAYLGGEASTMSPIFQIGKASLTPELITALNEALEKRELIKISVLKNCADDPNEIRGYFAEVKSLYDKYKDSELERVDFEYLSMGMTHDFEVAILEGSNLIRVGTAIFGYRDYRSEENS